MPFVQAGTTSYSAATSVEGGQAVEVYTTTVDAKMALVDGEVDALVADLHTAFQDSPMSLEHFPSGSLAAPPPGLRKINGKMD